MWTVHGHWTTIRIKIKTFEATADMFTKVHLDKRYLVAVMESTVKDTDSNAKATDIQHKPKSLCMCYANPEREEEPPYP